jgi:hypothetical protein
MTVRFDLQKISPLHLVYVLNAVGAALSTLISGSPAEWSILFPQFVHPQGTNSTAELITSHMD